MERELFIRDADPEDAKKLVEIYSYYVLNTAVSFEYEAMRMRDHIVLEKLITGQQQHLSMLIRIIADRVSVRCCTKSWKKGLKNRA